RRRGSRQGGRLRGLPCSWVFLESGWGAVAHLDRVELIENPGGGLADPFAGGLHDLDGLLPVNAGRPTRHVRDRVTRGVHSVGSTDHQRDRLGLDLTDPAMPPRI